MDKNLAIQVANKLDRENFKRKCLLVGFLRNFCFLTKIKTKKSSYTLPVFFKLTKSLGF